MEALKELVAQLPRTFIVSVKCPGQFWSRNAFTHSARLAALLDQLDPKLHNRRGY